MSGSGDLEVLEEWAAGALARLNPAERRKLARAAATDLRRSQSQRIGAQQNPDGSPFAPRKRQQRGPLRGKKGRLKRRAAMFAKLRRPAFLRRHATADEISVGFANATVARVARVHQYGLRDRVARTPGAPEVTYPARVLLGFTDAERARLLDALTSHLAP